MIEFILNEANQPFAISIGIMLGLALLEFVLALGGLGLMGILDNLVPEGWEVDMSADIDADVDLDVGVDADLDVELDGDFNTDASGSTTLLQAVLGFFGVGRVPLLVVLVAFLTSFGLAGYATQAAVYGVAGFYVPAVLASIPAAIVGSFLTRHLAILLGRVIPDVETDAVESASFIGRTAVVTLGEARAGAPAEAKLRDHKGQFHYLLIEPDQRDVVFREGDRVLLVSQQANLFKAIAVTSEALARD